MIINEKNYFEMYAQASYLYNTLLSDLSIIELLFDKSVVMKFKPPLLDCFFSLAGSTTTSQTRCSISLKFANI